MLLKSNVDPQVQEARKRSALIDRQIETDAFARRNKCSVLIMSGSHEGNFLLTDSFAALSDLSGAPENLDPLGTANPDLFRKHLLLEAKKLAWVMLLGLGEDEPSYRRAIAEKMENADNTLDRDCAELILNLWSFDGCRKASLEEGRPEAYDKM